MNWARRSDSAFVVLALSAAACGGIASNVGGPFTARAAIAATAGGAPSTSTATQTAQASEAVTPTLPTAPTMASSERVDEAEGQSRAADASAPGPLFVSLPVPGFAEAVVAMPSEPLSPRPVLVVLHGMGGRPDANCQAWRSITEARAFVLCPRGQYDPTRSTKTDRRYTHPGGEYLSRHIEAALNALEAQYPGRVDADRPALAGFSLGATEVALLAQSSPVRFPRVAVLEGGLDVWAPATVSRFATAGGKRVLFGCGSVWCPAPALAAAKEMEDAGIGSRVVVANVGHTYDEPLQTQIRSELSWFFEGDPRWELGH